MHRPSSLASSRFWMSASLRDASAEKSTPVRAVHFAGHQLDTFLKRHIPRVQRLELGLVVAGVHDGIGQLQRAFAAVFPVRGQGHARPGRFAQFTDFGDFRLGVGHKSVDAHHGDTPERFTVLMWCSRLQQPASTKPTFSVRYSSGRGRPGTGTGAPPWLLSARTVATTTAASGVRPL